MNNDLAGTEALITDLKKQNRKGLNNWMKPKPSYIPIFRMNSERH